MPFTKFTNLDFDQIKQQIKDYLRANSNFTDFDFEGSNFSVLIDTLAYNTYISAFNSNLVVNESFLDSATLRENVVSLARNIGYVPRSKRAAVATVSINVTGISTTNTSISIDEGVIANAGVNGINYTYSLPQRITAPSEFGESNGFLQIYQGQLLEKQWVVNLSQANQRYILPNDSIDTSTLRVYIKENESSTIETEFKEINSIVGITSTSNTFLIQETSDEKYELLFDR